VGEFAPLAFALTRVEGEANEAERVVVDVRVQQILQTRIASWVNLLGQDTSQQLVPIAGNVASGEIILAPLGQPLHLFGGLQDFQSPLVVHQGRLKPAGGYTQLIRGFIGAWPRPHILDRFIPPHGPADIDGYRRVGGLAALLSLWHLRWEDFFIFSFNRDVLAEVAPQLAMIPAERPAQIRVHVDDLSDKLIASTVTAFGYAEARRTSASGSRFMNSLSTQLHVPPAECRELAELLVAGRFDCPLGGDYALIEEPGHAPLWSSTAVTPSNRFLLTEIPIHYEMPFLTWFRGVSAEVTREDDVLGLHAEINMLPQIEAPPPPAEKVAPDGEPLPKPNDVGA
jgi:hypothetical protein